MTHFTFNTNRFIFIFKTEKPLTEIHYKNDYYHFAYQLKFSIIRPQQKVNIL